MVGWASRAQWSLVGFLTALVLVAVGVIFLPPLTEGIDWLTERSSSEGEAPLKVGEQPVEMEVAGISTHAEVSGIAVVLKEKDGERYLPIWIGLLEGLSIDVALRKELPPRPLTHDLLHDAIEVLDGELSFIIINELLEDVFYARVAMKTQNGRQIEFDSRPSDAIALALRFGVPIYVEEWVLEKVISVQQK